MKLPEKIGQTPSEIIRNEIQRLGDGATKEQYKALLLFALGSLDGYELKLKKENIIYQKTF